MLLSDSFHHRIEILSLKQTLRERPGRRDIYPKCRGVIIVQANAPIRRKPLVTLITPTYNQAAFLEETIQSVLAQDYENIEYIIINDGSTDSTAQILDKYKGAVKSENQANAGQASTLNKGWHMGKGELLGYLSSDDILHPSAVRKAVEYLTAHPEVVMVYPNCDLIDPNSRVIRTSLCRPFEYESLVVDQECYIGPGALFRRSALEQMGGWDPTLRLGPDREFWMRIGLLGRIQMIDEICAQYRMHPSSISYYQTDAVSANEFVRVAEKYFARNDVPAEIIAKKQIAFSKAHLVAARIHLRGGRFGASLREIATAYKYNRRLNPFSILLMLARTSTSRSIHRLIWNIRHILSESRKSG